MVARLGDTEAAGFGLKMPMGRLGRTPADNETAPAVTLGRLGPITACIQNFGQVAQPQDSSGPLGEQESGSPPIMSQSKKTIGATAAATAVAPDNNDETRSPIEAVKGTVDVPPPEFQLDQPLKIRDEIIEMELEDLKPHPLNVELYGEEDDEDEHFLELVESIAMIGRDRHIACRKELISIFQGKGDAPFGVMTGHHK